MNRHRFLTTAPRIFPLPVRMHAMHTATLLTSQNMHAARETLQTLLGREIVLHPSANGVERFLTAELSGDYAGVVRLAMSNNRGGGHGS